MKPNCIRAVFAALAGVGLLALPQAAAAQEPAPQLLPDVRGQVARDLSIQVGTGVRNLRLTTTVANAGLGALEIFPVPASDCDGDGDPANDRLAFQRVFRDSDGSGFFNRSVDLDSTAYPAGCMIYHPEHAHWHFEDFASYELLLPGTLEVVASATKVSFCVLDYDPFAPGLLGHPIDPYYGPCDEDSTEGISVGWSDTYASSLPGQAIDIRGVPDGEYCLAVTGDPSDILIESAESNNRAMRPIALSGNFVGTSDAPCDVQPAGSSDTRFRAKAVARCGKLKRKARKGGQKKRRKCRRPA